MRRFIPLGTALALAAATLTVPLAGTTASAEPDATSVFAKAKPKKPKKPKVKPTPYAFRAHGYGTRVVGGQLPAASGATALAVIGCTNKTGINRDNNVAEVKLPGLGTISGVRTDVRTVKTATEVASISEHKVAQIVLAESALGRLSIEGVTSYSKASATSAGYATETETTLAKLVFRAPGGEAQVLPLPTLNKPIEVPGLLRVAIGDQLERTGPDFARARANGLTITLIPTKTKIVVGRTVAFLTKGIQTGLFVGSSNATSTELLSGLVGTGRTQRITMPCQGTDGQVKHSSALDLTIPGLLDVGTARSSQMGEQRRRRAFGFEESSVAGINLGNGALVVDAIKARVNVSRVKGKPAAVDFKGSTLAGITVDGETYSLPELDGLEIPGVAKIETMVEERFNNGGQITALRITLLNGMGGVINLGQAKLKIARSGR
ncbi:choice-of-anchor P family protein [Nocardioides sp. W7]|uniref:choice-of-anchor P family protein n=1 Tax=Nocardioides sp. W7 TaxID=2931390 RepID=UPI001FD1CCEE|nr:choice-of-anchor P family protein [Nocardioides sp. W7]